MNAGAKKYKYPFDELVAQLRRTEPSQELNDPLAIGKRFQWVADVRAVARAISKSSITNFDPEHFCHCLGVPYSLRAETVCPNKS